MTWAERDKIKKANAKRVREVRGKKGKGRRESGRQGEEEGCEKDEEGMKALKGDKEISNEHRIINQKATISKIG